MSRQNSSPARAPATAAECRTACASIGGGEPGVQTLDRRKQRLPTGDGQ